VVVRYKVVWLEREREKVCLLWVVWVGLVGREGEWER